MANITFNERIRFDSSGNIGIGTSPTRGIKLLDFTVFEDGDGYQVQAGNNTSVTVSTYAEVEELFRVRFAEWKLEQD